MKIVLSFSGGLDSTVLLYWLRNFGYEVLCLTVNYNQRHSREIDVATAIVKRMGIRHQLLDLSGLNAVLRGSSQVGTEIDVPKGYYTDETMKLTVVPNRNMILLAAAAAFAISEKAEGVAYAAHQGDHTIYPDCRAEFVYAMQVALNLCDWSQLALVTPFLGKTKADIVAMGASLGVPFEQTWSCYEGREKHCGECGTCVERKEAFKLAKIHDPTEYE